METIRCRKCGTEYHTATENLNQGKYLKCMVCAGVVQLRHPKASGAIRVLLRLRHEALSLLRLVGKRARQGSGRPARAFSR